MLMYVRMLASFRSAAQRLALLAPPWRGQVHAVLGSTSERGRRISTANSYLKNILCFSRVRQSRELRYSSIRLSTALHPVVKGNRQT